MQAASRYLIFCEAASARADGEEQQFVGRTGRKVVQVWPLGLSSGCYGKAFHVCIVYMGVCTTTGVTQFYAQNPSKPRDSPNGHPCREMIA